MNRKIAHKISCIACLIFVFVSSCSKTDEAAYNKMFYLQSKGAQMPIWVRGNLASNVLILHLHGGPGEGSLYESYSPFWQKLETAYGVVYWDQRGSGSSNGNVDSSTITYAQFGQDCHDVIRLLKKEFPDKEIFLLGHSFGVELGWQFLTTDDWQNEVKGFMLVDGTYSAWAYFKHQYDYVQEQAVLQNRNDIYSWTLDHPLTPENVYDASFNEDQLFAYQEILSQDKTIYHFGIASRFLGPYDHWRYITGSNLYRAPLPIFYEGHRFDFSPKLPNVTIPVQILWGRKDGNEPLQIGIDTDSLLVNSPHEMIVFDSSWHSPMHSETDKFYDAVHGFVEMWK